VFAVSVSCASSNRSCTKENTLLGRIMHLLVAKGTAGSCRRRGTSLRHELRPGKQARGYRFANRTATRLQLALRTRDKRKLRADEGAQHAASAICWSGVDGCDGNYRRRGSSVGVYCAHFSCDSSRDLHRDCALLAEIGCDISHRRGWFFSAPQIHDNEH